MAETIDYTRLKACTDEYKPKELKVEKYGYSGYESSPTATGVLLVPLLRGEGEIDTIVVNTEKVEYPCYPEKGGRGALTEISLSTTANTSGIDLLVALPNDKTTSWKTPYYQVGSYQAPKFNCFHLRLNF